MTLALCSCTLVQYSGVPIMYDYDSSGNAHPQSSDLAEPLWTNPGPKSGTGVHEPVST